MQLSKNKLSAALAALLLINVFGTAVAKDVRSTLFGDTDQLMEQAREAQADILSPKNFEAAEVAYQRAEEHMAKGRADKATRELDKADVALSEALTATKLAKVTFEDALKFRLLAEDANAAHHEAELWNAAETELNFAATTLEAGSV